MAQLPDWHLSHVSAAVAALAQQGGRFTMEVVNEDGSWNVTARCGDFSVRSRDRQYRKAHDDAVRDLQATVSAAYDCAICPDCSRFRGYSLKDLAGMMGSCPACRCEYRHEMAAIDRGIGGS